MSAQVLFFLKGMDELCMMFLFGQLMMWLFLMFAGEEQKKRNFVYSLFCVITGPIFKTARFLAPKFVLDKHLGLFAFGVLFSIWFFLIAALPAACAKEGYGIEECKARSFNSSDSKQR